MASRFSQPRAARTVDWAYMLTGGSATVHESIAYSVAGIDDAPASFDAATMKIEPLGAISCTSADTVHV